MLYVKWDLSEFCPAIHYRGFAIGCNHYKYQFITPLKNRIFGVFVGTVNYIRTDGTVQLSVLPNGYFPTIEDCKSAIDKYYENKNSQRIV